MSILKGFLYFLQDNLIESYRTRGIFSFEIERGIYSSLECDVSQIKKETNFD